MFPRVLFDSMIRPVVKGNNSYSTQPKNKNLIPRKLILIPWPKKKKEENKGNKDTIRTLNDQKGTREIDNRPIL